MGGFFMPDAGLEGALPFHPTGSSGAEA
ncbi:protein of unknown function [Candidatus Methylocalor cossyra]|uniref:Uncharacterized protein n=1 Tax=Candidatus Methylocalor cossyra TaxID=3108543 RepID=A0ABM9NLR3_9GAMM